MTLLLIRHAETDLAGTFCGHSDPPINSRGRHQIETLLTGLLQHEIEAVYTSDLQRAAQTAEAIANAFEVPININPRLREICFGEWESSTWSQIEQRDPAYARRWIEAYPNLPAPGGEQFEAFEARVLSAFDSIATLKKNAAIVAHAGVLRVLCSRRCGLSDAQSWLSANSYCSVFLYSQQAATQ